MRTLLIKINTDSSLKTLLDLVEKLKLKPKIINETTEQESEHDDWMTFNAQNFVKGYSNDEPNISHLEIKEPNPDYKPD
ncbi:MAG: hypothetical protein ABI855_10625 [Bacteroidota bacterium]